MTTQSGNNIENSFPFRDRYSAPRPLYANFDLYTEGDEEFKKELGTQVIGNVEEFRQALADSIRENQPEFFIKACHKIKFTLSILNDQEFNDLIAELEKDLAGANKDKNFIQRSKYFESLCTSIIRSLNIEINGVDRQ
jgi:hypothetical protein